MNAEGADEAEASPESSTAEGEGGDVGGVDCVAAHMEASQVSQTSSRAYSS